jgi:UDP-N-acetylmuramate--alanine ligase
LSLSIDGITCHRVHFIGIYGSGMSALAQYACWAGVAVTGSDRGTGRAHTRDVDACLRAAGCRVYAQDGTGVDTGPDVCIVSTAVERDNPDVRRAQTRNVPLIHRSRLLAALVAQHTTIAVAGTSGKSSVSGMIFELLQLQGVDASCIIGARVRCLDHKGVYGNAWHGSADILVVEADESDGSLVEYAPAMSVFLNISKDHKPVADVLALFDTLAGASGRVLVNGDDPGLARLPRQVTFGTGQTAQYRISSCRTQAGGSSFRFHGHDCQLTMPGIHNVYNVAAAATVCAEMGYPLADILGNAARLTGMRRRFELIHHSPRVRVVDDYAHNPAKIDAAVATAQGCAERVVAIFQPHGFSPLQFFFEELVAVLQTRLRPEDEIVLLPVYYAGGTARAGVRSADVVQRLQQASLQARSMASRAACLQYLQDTTPHGACILLMGARDPSLGAFARQIAAAVDPAGAESTKTGV